jgi:hypothetical protein
MHHRLYTRSLDTLRSYRSIAGELGDLHRVGATLAQLELVRLVLFVMF